MKTENRVIITNNIHVNHAPSKSIQCQSITNLDIPFIQYFNNQFEEFQNPHNAKWK